MLNITQRDIGEQKIHIGKFAKINWVQKLKRFFSGQQKDSFWNEAVGLKNGYDFTKILIEISKMKAEFF